MTNKKRVLLTSVSIIVLCLCAIVGMTYALFTDSVSVKNHLKAGNLDVSLVRTDLEYCVLNDEGYLEVLTNSTEVDFTSTTSENIFGIDSADCKVAPGSYFNAELELRNNGNVAFTYNVTIKLIEGNNELAEQLEVTLTHADGSTSVKKLSELASGLVIEVGEMSNSDDKQVFSIKVEFIDDINNNLAKNQTVVFDLIVTAVQASK